MKDVRYSNIAGMGYTSNESKTPFGMTSYHRTQEFSDKETEEQQQKFS